MSTIHNGGWGVVGGKLNVDGYGPRGWGGEEKVTIFCGCY